MSWIGHVERMEDNDQEGDERENLNQEKMG